MAMCNDNFYLLNAEVLDLMCSLYVPLGKCWGDCKQSLRCNKYRVKKEILQELNLGYQRENVDEW